MKAFYSNVLRGALALPALLLALSSCTIQQAEKFTRTVSVNGTGKVELENDQATISLAVNTRNWDVIKATEENASRMTAVREALIGSGISSDYIYTSGYSLYQESSYQNGRTIPGQYNVTNRINVIVKDISRAGNVIDTAIKAGANQLISLSYSVSNAEAAVKQARLLAVKQAESVANTLATSSAASLGKILTIQEYTPSTYTNAETGRNFSSKLMAEAASADTGAMTPTSGGKTVITVEVNATYELQ
ncbi:MAG: SIMPL domain-containing protein [Treponema sp.]|nr:SIMPL domain-containing protein [Treponema sp.]